MSLAELDIGILTNCPTIRARVEEVCSEFSYQKECWSDLDQFLSLSPKAKLLVAYLGSPEGALAPPELAQLVRHASSDVFLICVSDTQLSKDAAAFAKKSGADLVLLREEILNSGKLEFICSQTLRTRFLPIKPSDLTPEHSIPFNLYHLLPQRKKFLKMLFAGDCIDPKKMQKAKEVGEIYIERMDASSFEKYISEKRDLSAAGIERRCRAKFLALFAEFSELAFQVSNQSEQSTFGEGQLLLNRCGELCAELLSTLAEGGEAWKIVNNSAIGEFGSLERAPAIAAYCGIFGLRIGLADVDKLMLAALLSDIGLLTLPTSITRKIRSDTDETLSEIESASFRQYPQTSLDLILSRKLSIPENLRLWITSTRERADGKGFPKGLAQDRLPIEPRLIAFCRDFDQRALVKMGKARIDPTDALHELLEDPDAYSLYGESLVQTLKAAISPAVAA